MFKDDYDFNNVELNLQTKNIIQILSVAVILQLKKSLIKAVINEKSL